jgi:PE family/PPE-SVP subfamily C-terminal region
MPFVTMQPEALAAAASKLQALGSSMAAQNAAAAAPTTGVVPAAADEVSALQATQFSAYGQLYQAVSAHATAVHQTMVNTLITSAGSYGQTEAANQAATGSTSLSGLAGGATAAAAADPPAAAAAADPPSLSSIISTLGGGNFISTSAGSTLGTPVNYGQTVGAAASDFFTLADGAFWPGASEFDPSEIPQYEAAGLMGSVSGGLPAAPAAPAVAPAGSADLGAAPVLAGVGQANSVGELSVPPSWAGEPGAAVSPTPATLAGAGWTGAEPQTAPVTAMPAGMPSVASAGRGGFGFGAPRYGTKPTVMHKPSVV